MHFYYRAPKKDWSGGQAVREDLIQVPNFLKQFINYPMQFWGFRPTSFPCVKPLSLNPYALASTLP